MEYSAPPKWHGEKPALPINQDNRFWIEGLDSGRLLIQKCETCGELRHPPVPMCGECQSLAWNAVDAEGRGRVYSYAIQHRPQIEGFPRPFAIVLVELAEGVRLVGNLVDTPIEACRIGLDVEVVFIADATTTQILPQWRAAGTPAA